MSPRATTLAPCQNANFLKLATAFLAMVLAAQSARADEVYFCDGGRMVTVRFGELEQLKRTDPCIASHFARRAPRLRTDVAADATAAPATDAPAAEAAIIAGAGAGAGANMAPPPLPVRKSHDIAAAAPLRLQETEEVIVHHEAPPRHADAVAETSLAGGELVARVTPVVFKHARRILRPLYAGAIDDRPAPVAIEYRRVPIINAQPGEPAVFHHRR